MAVVRPDVSGVAIGIVPGVRVRLIVSIGRRERRTEAAPLGMPIRKCEGGALAVDPHGRSLEREEVAGAAVSGIAGRRVRIRFGFVDTGRGRIRTDQQRVEVDATGYLR